MLLLKRNFFNSTVSQMQSTLSGIEGINTPGTTEMKRTLLPVDTLVTWVIVGLSILLALKIVGLDPSPLLTVGSASGIVVGFASQHLLINLMAGISIFLTRPFIVGDIVDVRQNTVRFSATSRANRTRILT